MPNSAWDQRFFSSTRGKIVLLLREAPSTVEQLATALDLTDNAVRAHLAALERDDLVEATGTIRTARRPSVQYSLGPAADRFFPKAYGRVLKAVLGVFAQLLPSRDLDRALRRVGRELAGDAARPRARLSATARVERAVELIGELGGQVFVERHEGQTHLIGRSCPLALVVPEHPEVCGLVEGLLAEATGLPVREECEREGAPHCHFIIKPGSAAG